MAKALSSPESAPALRASDTDREHVVVVLREACAAGRLDADELAERVGAAYAARTLSELEPLTQDLVSPLTSEEKLAGAIERELARGWRIESRLSTRVVMVKREMPNHLLHGVLSFLTGGLWLPVWLALALRGRETRKVLEVHGFDVRTFAL